MPSLGPRGRSERDPVRLGELGTSELGLEQSRQRWDREALDKPIAAHSRLARVQRPQLSCGAYPESLIVAQGRFCKLLNRVKRRSRRFTMRRMSRV